MQAKKKPTNRGIRQRASGRWQSVVSVKNPDGTFSQVSKMFATQREAETWRLEQTDPRRRPRVERGMTVAALLDKWLAYQKGRLAPSTHYSYTTYVKNRINPHVGAITVDKLTVDDLDNFYITLSDDGLKAGSVRQCHAIIRCALAWGHKRRYVDLNVAIDADPPSQSRPRIDPPTPTEVQRLLTAATEFDEWFGVACRLAAATGARRGTVASFRLSDFRFVTNEVLIDRSLTVINGEQTVKGLKRDNGDWVPVGPSTLAIVSQHVASLHERAAMCGVTLADDFYLFATDIACTRPINPSSLTNRWGKVRSKCGLHRIRFHDLRHYVATELLAAGYDPVTIAARLRWDSATMLFEAYGHTRPERAREAAEHIERSLG